MARGSSSYSSYREWEAAQRAAERAEKKAEQERQKRARERAAAEAAARDEEAATKTAGIERRVAELEGMLRSSLTRNPRISFASLRRTVVVPPLNLGPLATQTPAPDWADFAPDRPSGLGRMFGGAKRYHDAYTRAEWAFAQAQRDHERLEAARQAKITEARATWKRTVAEERRTIEAHNAHIEKLEAGFRDHDRVAVSEYVQIVLDRSAYPASFPTRRQAGYVPESSLLAVEWYLPTFDIVPEHKAFRHIKTRKVVEPIPRPPAETRRLYQSAIAQIALRTLREVFAAAPEDMISTVVFNGHVDTVDPLPDAGSSRHSSRCAPPWISSGNSFLTNQGSTQSSASAGISSPISHHTQMSSSLSTQLCRSAWPTRASWRP
jgi:restriction system protein